MDTAELLAGGLDNHLVNEVSPEVHPPAKLDPRRSEPSREVTVAIEADPKALRTSMQKLGQAIDGQKLPGLISGHLHISSGGILPLACKHRRLRFDIRCTHYFAYLHI